MIHGNVKTIDVQELKKCMEQDPHLCLIDVREANEWEEQRIPGARHIPKGILVDTIATVVTDKHWPIYLHCKGGTRSLWAAERLVEMGYTDVYSVNSGITGWAQSGYPILNG